MSSSNYGPDGCSIDSDLCFGLLTILFPFHWFERRFLKVVHVGLRCQKKAYRQRYKQKDDLILYFFGSLDISGLCGTLPEHCEGHRSGKSTPRTSNLVRMQNYSCDIRAGMLWPSAFTVSKSEKVLYPVCINEFIEYSDAAVNETPVWHCLPTHITAACVYVHARACVRAYVCGRSSSGWRSLEYSVLDSRSLCFLRISKSTHRSSVYFT